MKTLPNALRFSRGYKTNEQDVFLFVAYFIKRYKKPVTGSRAPSLQQDTFKRYDDFIKGTANGRRLAESCGQDTVDTGHDPRDPI